MANKEKIISAIKKLWSFFVGISNIISCIAAVVSCYIAYTAASEIFHLNVEISPIVEKLRKDSVIVVEKNVPIIQKDTSPNSQSNITTQKSPQKPKDSLEQAGNTPKIEPNIDSDDPKYLPSSEVDNIRSRRDAFLEKMKPFFGKQQK